MKSTMGQRRKEIGLTQFELAERLGVHRVTVARYESGLRTPPPDVAERIAKELEWSLETMWASLYRNSSYHKFN